MIQGDAGRLRQSLSHFAVAVASHIGRTLVVNFSFKMFFFEVPVPGRPTIRGVLGKPFHLFLAVNWNSLTRRRPISGRLPEIGVVFL